jgi:hypothetical protein
MLFEKSSEIFISFSKVVELIWSADFQKGLITSNRSLSKTQKTFRFLFLIKFLKLQIIL